MEVDLHTETLKLALFWLQNGGSTYTWCRLIHGKIRYISNKISKLVMMIPQKNTHINTTETTINLITPIFQPY